MLKWLKRITLLLLALALVAVASGWLLMRGSLPQLDGELALPGLSAPVTLQRDALGVVTVDANNETDMARALGYVHAQERFFEMDLMRRTSAGELAELFGPAAVETDRQHRAHRMRARIEGDFAQYAAGKEAQLQAYSEGVNAGLAALKVRPWPYLLLRQRPAPWRPADSVLTGMAMYFDLQDSQNRNELALSRLRAVTPPALYALLTRDGSQWDAPLSGQARGDATLPDAQALDLRQPARAVVASALRAPQPDIPGSNNFAVAGALTADGRAIVADDMHLGLRAPNIWFRARLRYPDADAGGGQVDVSGFTLPGLPAVIVGSNGHVAWGFTNGYIDTADFRRLPAPGNPGAAVLVEHRETIRVAGADPVQLTVRDSTWGPVLDEEADGSLLALRWVAQLPGAVRVDFADMAHARNLDSALAVADRSRIPAQNLMLADRSGRIAWRIIGARPDRAPGCTHGLADLAVPAVAATAGDAALPPQAETCGAWPLRSDQAPALIDPPSHRLWTGNNRIVDGADLAQVGDAGYDLGARAQQIRDGLFARERFGEAELLAIQLDDRAVFLERWWRLLRQVVEGSDDPALKKLEAATRQWQGRASVGSVSYRLTRGFRGATLDAVYAGMLAPARERLGEEFIEPRLPQFEGVLWPLVTQRPAHLLPPPHESWDALLVDAARTLQADLSKQGDALDQRTWGERNTAAICHPIARALPAFLRPTLCMPADPLPGDSNMPRVQSPGFGASQRMVVSPGHEADGIVHMPGGQTGHRLSPFWGAGHRDWVEGKATPFLPGSAVYTMTLRAE
jgi:penicillin amidase